MPIEWVLPAVAVLLLVWGVIVRGRLVALQQAAVQAWTGLDEVLRRRHDLVVRLVEAVRGRVARERKSLDGAMKAVAEATSQQAPPSIGKAEAALSLAIGRVFDVVAENPGLVGDADLQRIQAEFSTLDKRILKAANLFNDAVRDYNEQRLGFAGAFLSFIIRFDMLQYYTVADAKPPVTQTAPVPL